MLGCSISAQFSRFSLDKNDRRFVDSYSVADSLSEATNLAAMDWQDFENLIRELFEKEFSQHGGERTGAITRVYS